MRTRDDRTLRRWALGVFATLILLDALYVLAADGLAGQPGLAHPFHLDLGEVSGVASLAVVGLILTWARPRVSIGWLLSLAGLLLALCDLGQTYGSRALVMPGSHLPGGSWALALSGPLWIPALLLPASNLLVRYPSGSITGRWPRRFDRAVIAGYVLVYVGYASGDHSVTDEVVGGTSPIPLPELVGGILMAAGALLFLPGTIAIVLDAIRRMIRGDRPERFALLWLVTTAVGAVLLVQFSPKEYLGSVAYFGQLVAIAVGVLRYRALGIDVVVRRTLLYATLTGLVAVVFVGIVAGLAQLIPSGPGPQIIAASVIAVGLAPARERIQSIIDRLLYGERSDPFAALERLGAPMDRSASNDVLLNNVVAAVGEGLLLPAVTLRSSAGSVLASWGAPDATSSTAVPLRFGGHDLGSLTVAPRRGEVDLTRADRRLLDALAPLIAAVVQSSELARDLVAERNRVVEATQSERARLRQELHDGLGPSLTGIGLGLEAAQGAPLAQDPRTAELLERLRHEVSSSLEEIRRIIDDLRPTVLDDHDLLTALRQRGERVTSAAGVAVHVDAPSALPELSPEVETAAFRIADEALTNVVRHANATRCSVRLSVGDSLRLVVSDDGVGVGNGRVGGVGLASMRQRAERIGGRFSLSSAAGGTEVVAELPLAVTP